MECLLAVKRLRLYMGPQRAPTQCIATMMERTRQKLNQGLMLQWHNHCYVWRVCVPTGEPQSVLMTAVADAARTKARVA